MFKGNQNIYQQNMGKKIRKKGKENVIIYLI